MAAVRVITHTATTAVIMADTKNTEANIAISQSFQPNQATKPTMIMNLTIMPIMIHIKAVKRPVWSGPEYITKVLVMVKSPMLRVKPARWNLKNSVAVKLWAPISEEPDLRIL